MMEESQFKGRKKNSQLIPLRTERATSLDASSYTCLVGQSVLKTRSTAKRNEGGSKKEANWVFKFFRSDEIQARYGHVKIA